MLAIFLLVLPIYLLIGLGFLVVRLRYVAGDDLRGAGQIVLKLFLPAMMFLVISGNPLSQTIRWDFIFAYAGGSLAIYGLGFVVARLSGRASGSAALEAMGMACSNSAFFALPVATLVVGSTVALQSFALAVLIENLLMLPLAVSLCEMLQGRGQGAMLRLLRALVVNPLTIAALAGLGWALAGLPVPEALDQTLHLMAPVAAPVALLAIGGAVAQMRLGDVEVAIPRIVIGKLIGHPTMVAAGFALVGTVPDPLRIAGVIGAGVPMMSIYSLFGQRFGKPGMTAAAQVLATVASFVSLTVLLRLIAV